MEFGHHLPSAKGGRWSAADLTAYEHLAIDEGDRWQTRKSEPTTSCRNPDFKFWKGPPGNAWPLCTVDVQYKRDQPVSCWAGHFRAHSYRSASGSVPSAATPGPMDLADVKCGYAPSSLDGPDFVPGRDNFWFGIDQTVALLDAALTNALKSKEVGLIAICGETSAAKSQHLLGLAYHRLMACDPFSRALGHIKALRNGDQVVEFPDRATEEVEYKHLHVLTLEEPIEDYLFYYSSKDGRKLPVDPRFGAALGVHFTPRDLLFDFPLDDPRHRLYEKRLSPLATALRLDALRQKPALVLVGESRSEEDLAEVVRFAATGHLIGTTFHAGSLQQGLAKILRSWHARHSSERGEVAGRVHAIIHIRGGRFAAHPGQERAYALPSVWLGTDRALDGLVKDGLRSVVPQRLPASPESAVLGRTYFAEKLLAARELQFASSVPEDFRKHLMTVAVGWDLEER